MPKRTFIYWRLQLNNVLRKLSNDALAAVMHVASETEEPPSHTVIARKAFMYHLSNEVPKNTTESHDISGYEDMKNAGYIGGEIA